MTNLTTQEQDLNSFIDEIFSSKKESVYVNPFDLTLVEFIHSHDFRIQVGLNKDNAEIINKSYIHGRISGLVSAWLSHNKTTVTGDFCYLTETDNIYKNLTQDDGEWYYYE